MKRPVLLLIPIVLAAALLYTGAQFKHGVDNQRPGSIVSLGDSVAAGAGLSRAVSRTVAGSCDRSSSAYPNVIGNDFHVPARQFACSGATTADLEGQLASARPLINSSAVIVTAGANDVGWSTAIKACISSECQHDPVLEQNFQNGLHQVSSNLDHVLPGIRAAHPKMIVVNQYYTLASDSAKCLQAYGITSGKISWFNGHMAALNKVLAERARSHGASVARLDFNGHTLCDSDTWLQTIFETAPLHPNTSGQNAIASQDELVIAPSVSQRINRWATGLLGD